MGASSTSSPRREGGRRGATKGLSDVLKREAVLKTRQDKSYRCNMSRTGPQSLAKRSDRSKLAEKCCKPYVT
ncbi:hypothetical protein BHE74_00038563 [Ensete ventricosum]|nr:hypothetical protein BHE74_00038563 [Ensete ventricosum]RZS13823.1 hypothetical protein BHM03_00045439 [Ensete ventricosum]